jgi:beta-lactamase class A
MMLLNLESPLLTPDKGAVMRHVNGTRRLHLALIVLGLAAGARLVAAGAPAGLDRLQAQITRAAVGARGAVGIAIKHLESGVELYVNGDEPYPMASTFKLPVLVELYAKAKAGKLSWDEMIDIGPLDQHLGSGELAPQFDLPGVKLSLHNVANLMMLVSDNSAADICLAKAGAAVVNAQLATLGIKGIRVDRSCQELILDHGGQDTAKLKNLPLKELQAAMRRPQRPQQEPQQTDEGRSAADDRYAADPRDQATPRAFVTLLEKIWRGEAVDRTSSDAILETMKRCTTGAQRIKGLLPRGIVVAHKTGSMGGVFDDVGIIYLPDNAGHVAIAVLTKSARAQSVDAEKAIAEIARFAFDYFLFTSAAVTTDSAGR